MVISDLILQLQQLQYEHGDIEVYTQGGCGCCIWSRDVEPRFSEEDPWEYFREGCPYTAVYL